MCAVCPDWSGISSAAAASSADGTFGSGTDGAIGLVAAQTPHYAASELVPLASGADQATPLDVPDHTAAQAGPSTLETAEPSKRERRKRDLDTEIPQPPALRDQSYRGEHGGYYKRPTHVSFQGEEPPPDTQPVSTAGKQPASAAGKQPARAAGKQPACAADKQPVGKPSPVKGGRGKAEEEKALTNAIAASLGQELEEEGSGEEGSGEEEGEEEEGSGEEEGEEEEESGKEEEDSGKEEGDVAALRAVMLGVAERNSTNMGDDEEYEELIDRKLERLHSSLGRLDPLHCAEFPGAVHPEDEQELKLFWRQTRGVSAWRVAAVLTPLCAFIDSLDDSPEPDEPFKPPLEDSQGAGFEIYRVMRFSGIKLGAGINQNW